MPHKGKRGRPRKRGRPKKIKLGRPRRRGRPIKKKRGRPKMKKGVLSLNKKKQISRDMKKKKLKKADAEKSLRLAKTQKLKKEKLIVKKSVKKQTIKKEILGESILGEETENNLEIGEIKAGRRKNDPFKDVFDGVHQTKIRIVAVGGGAGTIISEIATRVKKSDFFVANTDGRSLNALPQGIKRFQFGLNITKGLGTGMNPELGRLSAEEDKEKIKEILEGQDLTIILACLGGGTSSGATSTFASISKGMGNITYGIFTLPFEFEGEKKMEAALKALEEIRPHLDVFTVIPNENIFKIVDKNTPLKDALSAINKRLADNLEGLVETIYTPGLINIDFADLRAILTGKGRVAYLNTVELERTSNEEITQKLISSPIYPYTIKGAKGIIYNITSGRGIQLNEISQISNVILESANKKAKIIFGINQNVKHSDKAKIMILATGCTAKEFLPLTNILDDEAEEKQVKEKNAKKSKVVKKAKVEKEKKQEVPPAVIEKKPEAKAVVIEKDKKTPIVKAKVEKSPEIELAEEEKVVIDEKKEIINQEKPAEEKKPEVIVKTEEPVIIAKKRKERKPAPVKIEKKIEEPIVKSKPIKEKKKTQEKEEKISVNVLTEPKELTPAATMVKSTVSSNEFGKVRRNGLQLKKELENAEQQFLDQEKMWDIPAILRKKKIDPDDI